MNGRQNCADKRCAHQANKPGLAKKIGHSKDQMAGVNRMVTVGALGGIGLSLYQCELLGHKCSELPAT